MKPFAFRFLGFPVVVQPIAWILLGFILLSRASGGPSELLGGVVLAVVLFVSVMVHEVGHALVARHFGLGPVQITLHGFGGLTSYSRRPSPRRAMAILAAGPGAGLLLGGVSLALYLVLGVSGLAEGAALASPMGLLAALLDRLVTFNIFWSLFNLLPMTPLDGGWLLDSGLVVAGVTPVKVHRFVAIVSVVMAALVAVTAIAIHWWIILFIPFLVLQHNLPVLGLRGGRGRL